MSQTVITSSTVTSSNDPLGAVLADIAARSSRLKILVSQGRLNRRDDKGPCLRIGTLILDPGVP